MTAHEVPCKCRLHRLRLCVSTCPEVFTMTDGGTAAAAPADVTGPDEAAATDAMQTCPVGAIESVDG